LFIVVFLHGHDDCKKSKLPSTRRDQWARKIADNFHRDAQNFSKLTCLGWNIIVVWSCELSNEADVVKKLA